MTINLGGAQRIGSMSRLDSRTRRVTYWHDVEVKGPCQRSRQNVSGKHNASSCLTWAYGRYQVEPLVEVPQLLHEEGVPDIAPISVKETRVSGSSIAFRIATCSESSLDSNRNTNTSSLKCNRATISQSHLCVRQLLRQLAPPTWSYYHGPTKTTARRPATCHSRRYC